MSTEVQSVVKVENALDTSRNTKRSVHLATSINNKKQKQDEGRLKFRKRSQSFSGGKLNPPYKKRKKEKLILPTKFLLGGNIRDPLNLNSFQDEEVNRAMNAVTPESSPLPTPQHRKGEIEVIIPPNIRDPLSLAAVEDDDAYVASFITTSSKRIKKNKKKKKAKSSTGSGKEDNGDVRSDESKGEEAIEVELKKEIPAEIACPPAEVSTEETKPQPVEETVPPVKREIPVKPPPIESGNPPPKRPCNLSDRITSSQIVVQQLDKTATNSTTVGAIGNSVQAAGISGTKVLRKFDNKDKIVSPVVPQPGAWLDRHHHARFRKQSVSGNAAPPAAPTGTNMQVPKFKEANKKFQYGNYHRYYGYRNPNEEDSRLKLICQRLGVTYFQDKDVLDIGCNSGQLTTAVAKDLGAKHVIGMDIDKSLITVAKTSLARYAQTMGSGSDHFKQGQVFPLSMPVVYGSLNVPGVKDRPFPRNITFIQGNYVLESSVLLDMQQPQFDVILCLSVTKWIHLNWGDEGLKRAFKRMFAQLRPGGVLILEPQSLASYKKKKNLTETTWKNFQNIKLLPTNFTEYLLSEVGFSKCEVIGSPYNPSKGFQRPIKLFTKGRNGTTGSDTTPSSSCSTTNKTPAVDETPPTTISGNTAPVDEKMEVQTISIENQPLSLNSEDKFEQQMSEDADNINQR